MSKENDSNNVKNTVEVSDWIRKGIRKRFSDLKKRHGNQKNFANEIGFSRSTISGIETGENLPSGNVMLSLVQKGYSLDWFILGKGMMRFPDRPDSVRDTPEVYGNREVEEHCAWCEQAPDASEKLKELSREFKKLEKENRRLEILIEHYEKEAKE